MLLRMSETTCWTYWGLHPYLGHLAMTGPILVMAQTIYQVKGRADVFWLNSGVGNAFSGRCSR